MKARSFPTAGSPAMPATETHSVPMMRLFDERDIEFLRAVPGYTRHMETEFRRRRCRIFRGYLRSRRGEFLGGQTELETLRIGVPKNPLQLALEAKSPRIRFNSPIVAPNLYPCPYPSHLVR